MVKKRIIKDYHQMPDELLLKMKSKYPHGYQEHLLKFTNANGEMVSALPFETDDIYYLVKIEHETRYQLIDEEDGIEDDYDDLADAEELDLDDSEE